VTQPLGVLAAFVRRDFATLRSYRVAYLLEITGAILEIALFFYLSRLVDASNALGGQLRGGYFPFVIIGVTLFALAQTAFRAFPIRLRQEQTLGTLEVLLASPASPRLILCGVGAYDLVRALVLAVVSLLLALALFRLELDVTPLSLLAAVAGTLGATALFAAAGVLLAAFGILYKQVTGVIGLTGTLIGLLAGVYFPIALLPAPVEQVAAALPFTWALDLIRGGLIFGEVDALRLVGVVASGVVGLLVAFRVFDLSIDHARRRGSLGQY